MGKRTVTRVGDIFCVDLDGKYKRYFQYVAKDEQELGSAVIQIFRRRYPMEYEPDLDEIVNDDVVYHFHTFIQVGTKAGAWEKVGNSKKINQESLDNAIFGDGICFRIIEIPAEPFPQYDYDIVEVDPLDNWEVWRINTPKIKNVRVPEEMWSKISAGGVYPYTAIAEWIKLGYNKFKYPIFRMKQRIPWDYLDSYVKLPEGNNMYYYHFHGENAVREIIVTGRGNVIRLSVEKPKAKWKRLRTARFWEAATPVISCRAGGGWLRRDG